MSKVHRKSKPTDINGIQFGVLSPDEILKMSVCEITNPRILQPSNNTVYDKHLGPYKSTDECATCKHGLNKCPGHFGHINLNYPIINPLFKKYVINFLECVCIECSNLKITKDELKLYNGMNDQDRIIRYKDRIKENIELCKSRDYCKECNIEYPAIKEKNGIIYKVYKIDKKNVDIMMDNREVRLILSRIPDDVISLIGFQPQIRAYGAENDNNDEFNVPLSTFRPEWMVLTVLPVIPPMARPPTNEGDERSDDDLTISYTDIIKINNQLESIHVEENARKKAISELSKQIKGLFDNSDNVVIRNSTKPSRGIKERMSDKNGHVRGKLLGKRVDLSARTVITAGPNIKINELGVPYKIAEKLSYPERVTSKNIDHLTQLLADKKVNSYKRGHKKYMIIPHIPIPHKLKIGDIVYRQLQNGDTVIFNRQPSLHKGSKDLYRKPQVGSSTSHIGLSAGNIHPEHITAVHGLTV